MRRWLLTALAIILLIGLWTAVVTVGTLDGWWRKPLAPKGDRVAFAAAADQMMRRESRGNAAFALIENGRTVRESFTSIGTPVDRESLFQVASLSKWVTALGVMSLVEAGRVNLDAPVETYLKRWRLPPSEFDHRGVTVRRLLSHTAGLTDGLGYGGFKPGQPVQPLVESLTKAADASPGADGAVRVGLQPGSEWRYSGGGYALLQVMIEDVTGEPFDDYIKRTVLRPLQMNRSTFVLPDTGATGLAAFYDTAGGKAPHFRFSATGAASLYTSVADLTRLIQAHGPAAAPRFLKSETLKMMHRPEGYQYGAEIWGLGVVLYAPNNAGGFIVGHDGSNDPAINTTARVEPASGDGIVLLATGNRDLATRIAGEWVFWRTGHVDTFTVLMEIRQTLTVLLGGWVAIVLLGLIGGWRLGRRRIARPVKSA